MFSADRLGTFALTQRKTAGQLAQVAAGQNGPKQNAAVCLKTIDRHPGDFRSYISASNPGRSRFVPQYSEPVKRCKGRLPEWSRPFVFRAGTSIEYDEPCEGSMTHGFVYHHSI